MNPIIYIAINYAGKIIGFASGKSIFYNYGEIIDYAFVDDSDYEELSQINQTRFL